MAQRFYGKVFAPNARLPFAGGGLDWRRVKFWFELAAMAAVLAALFTADLAAHPISFNSTVTYSSSQPAVSADSVANWTGASFDADNVGGSGVNADGGSNNGTANDDYTYVANNRPVQGQTFRTGGAANGYQLHSITVRMAGYSNNVASGSNNTFWNLNPQNGPIIVVIHELVGTNRMLRTMQPFIAGVTGNPGAGNSPNGAGEHITFHLPFKTKLKPDTTYGFELVVGNGGANTFEWHGINGDPYPDGTAYHRAGSGIEPLGGDRVFLADMTALASPPEPFLHPGTLHTQSDLDRMKARIAANEEPWISGYNMLLSSPYNNLGWPAYDVDYIVRGGSGNNYTRSQQDAQLIYTLTLIWHLTGDTAYADRAVQIANVWSDLLGVTGDSNQSLAAGICGYLFAIAGDLLSTYPGWMDADKQAYKDMMMRVFYPSNFDFLWRHHDTFWRNGGNTHYRLNWVTANMASMAAIGILCDNRAVYEQAIDFFKYGPNNGRVERAAWYIFPEGLSQTEESGRDQPHNLGGWHAMALLCQTAWNQGDDLFGYDNNRVLRAFEYNAKYNLGNNVPWTFHRNTTLTYTETLSNAGRGLGGYYQYELVYNHYVNLKGIAAPWSKLAADATRPEPWPNTGIHPSQVDWFGLGTLTYSRDPITTDQAPTGLRANWSKNRIVLDWWGSARATGHLVKRATSAGGPYAQIGMVTGPDLNFTDTNVVNDTTYFYIVTAETPTGDLDSTPLRVAQELVTHYAFEGSADDVVGGQDGVLKGGSTGLPGYSAGFDGGQAIDLDGVDDYVQLPVGVANSQDITVAAWVRWDGGGNWQRIFDFGSEIEKYMFLTPRSGGGTLRFEITTSRNTDGTGRLDGPVLPTGQWTHVAVTLNGDAGTLYVNGVPVDSRTITLDPLFGQPFCYIGRSMWNADPLFNGRIDDFRIYNHALSGTEVYALWGQSANNAPEFSADPIDLSAANEDAAYTGQTLADFASDADGGSPTFSKVTGPAWLTVASNGSLSGTPGNSDVGLNVFVVRVRDSAGATDDATLRINVENVNDAPAWQANPVNGGEVTRGVAYTGSLAGKANDIDAGDVISFSKVDGPEWLSVAADGSLSGTPGAGDVGANSFAVRATDSEGAFADATLNIAVLDYSLRSHYQFENNTSDGIGTNPGTATGSPTYTTGRIGQAIVLDGADDFVTLAYPLPALIFEDITVATWVYWNGGNQWQRIFDFGNNTDQNLFLTPRSGGNTLRFAIKNGGSEQQLNTTQLPAGQWMHVVVTLGGNVGRLYVNGVLRTSNTGMTINPGDFVPAVNYIGKSQWPDPLFNGRIDDFRIYNYEINPAEVSALYTGIPAVPTGLAATAGDGEVSLTWDAAFNATGYNVKRSTADGGPYDPLFPSVANTSYTDTGLDNGTVYYYVVSATNATGESANSGQVSARPVSSVPPQLGVAIDGNDLQLTWPVGHTGWRLEAQTNAPGEGIGTNWVTVSDSTDTNQIMIPVAVTNGSVFQRLVYP